MVLYIIYDSYDIILYPFFVPNFDCKLYFYKQPDTLGILIGNEEKDFEQAVLILVGWWL